ncbi:MAG: hypothetical protein U9N09_05820 [Euryarchaeota archaeon]|nr:hypothetical protein [Euryarchaeota archaeon]
MADFDTVDPSNLNRQILHRSDDVCADEDRFCQRETGKNQS